MPPFFLKAYIKNTIIMSEKITEIHLPVKFNKDLNTIKEFAEEAKELSISGIDDKVGYQDVYDKLQKAKKTRTALGKTKSELKRKVKQQVTNLIDNPISKMEDVLTGCINDLQEKREGYEKLKEEEKIKVFNASVQPLLDAGLEDRGNGNYAIGNIILTKAQISRADMTQIFAWEMEIEAEKVRLDEEAQLLATAKNMQTAGEAVAEEKEEQEVPGSSSGNARRGVAEALDQPSTEKGPLSGRVEPEHGKHRSTLSHVQEIRDHVQKMREGKEEQDLRSLLHFIDEKIKNLENL